MPMMALQDPPAIEISYVGGPTAVLSIGGLHFITDPTFDPAGGEYASGTVRLRKTAGPNVSRDELGHIDVALVSHDQHPDNLDHAGRALLQETPVVLTTKAGAARLGHGAIGLDAWDVHTVKTPSGLTLRITGTPARHGPAGIEKLSGDVIGFVISIADTNQDLVYVTGDTVWYEGTREVARRFHPRVVLLFAGGAMTRGPFLLTMGTNDAIETAAAFPGATIVPVHHEGWAHFTQTQQDLRKTFDTLGFADRLQLVEAGKPLRFGSLAGQSAGPSVVRTQEALNSPLVEPAAASGKGCA